MIFSVNYSSCVVRLIIHYVQLVAYIIVLMISVVIHIYYAIASVVGWNIKCVDEMPARYAVVVRLAIEDKSRR